MNSSLVFFWALVLIGSVVDASTYEISITNTSRRENFGGQNISGPSTKL